MRITKGLYKEEIMKTLKMLGLVLALGLSTTAGFVTGLAKPDEFGDCPQCWEEPQVDPPVTYSTTLREAPNGALQLIFYLDLNGNEELDEGEPIVQVITIVP